VVARKTGTGTRVYSGMHPGMSLDTRPGVYTPVTEWGGRVVTRKHRTSPRRLHVAALSVVGLCAVPLREDQTRPPASRPLRPTHRSCTSQALPVSSPRGSALRDRSMALSVCVAFSRVNTWIIPTRASRRVQHSSSEQQVARPRVPTLVKHSSALCMGATGGTSHITRQAAFWLVAALLEPLDHVLQFQSRRRVWCARLMACLRRRCTVWQSVHSTQTLARALMSARVVGSHRQTGHAGEIR
jgi:hypothetical protein